VEDFGLNMPQLMYPNFTTEFKTMDERFKKIAEYSYGIEDNAFSTAVKNISVYNQHFALSS